MSLSESKLQNSSSLPIFSSDNHRSETNSDMAHTDELTQVHSLRAVPSRQPSHAKGDSTQNSWDGPDDPDNPFNWSIWKKRFITFLAVLATFTTLIDGTIITAAHEAIGEEFGVSDATFPNSYWPVATWAMGGAISVLVILPVMEDFGVRIGFLGTWLVYLCFLIPTAVSQSFAALCVTRFFVGACVSVLANTSAGVISNIWEDEVTRSIPVSLYILAYLTGTSIGPAVGGAIISSLHWRWIGYIQLIFYGALFPVYFIFFSETRGDVILLKRQQKQSKSAGPAGSHLHAPETTLTTAQLLSKLRISVQRPLYMLFTEPVVFFVTLWSAFTVGTIYMATQSVEQVFVGLYGWSIPPACYVQSAIVLGQLFGFPFTLISRHYFIASSATNTEHPGTYLPESRLYVSIPGSFIFLTGGLFVYAWTSFSSLPWIAPSVGIFMIGAGTTIIMDALASYIVDGYAAYAGSAIAAVILGENIFSAFLPLATQSMYENLGYNWASTLLGFVALALSFVPVVFVWKGRVLRERSKFMVSGGEVALGQSQNEQSTTTVDSERRKDGA